MIRWQPKNAYWYEIIMPGDDLGRGQGKLLTSLPKACTASDISLTVDFQ